MRIIGFALVVGGVIGCGDPADLLQTERQPATPAGIAPLDGSGDPEHQGNEAAAVPAPNENQPEGNPPEQQERTGIIGKQTAKVVDKKQAMAENPNLVVVENETRGNDPLSIAASAYISMSSRVSILNFQHQLNLWKAQNDRAPSYDEIMQMVKQHGIQFAMLPPYQMYGYDSDSGTLVVLEDREDKARRYREAGIPLDQ